MNNELRIKRLLMIHMAITMGQVVLSLIAFFMVDSIGIYLGLDDPFVLAVPFISIATIAVGNLLYKKKIEQIRSSQTGSDKISAFTIASIIRLALCEMGTLIAIVAYFQSGNLFFLIIAGIIILYFFSMTPTDSKLRRQAPFLFKDQSETFYR